MKAKAAEFVEEMLRLIRREFFAQVPEKQFWQQRDELKLAITQPAAWLRTRGGQWVTIGLMKRIVGTVIAAIKKHGDRANIGRFSVYFLHCVQGHMNHHGDEYLQEAKRMPTAGRFVKVAIQDLKSSAGSADPGAVLAETNRVLGRGRRRIRKGQDVDLAADLFGHCKAAAGPSKQSGKFLKPLQDSSRGAIPPQTATAAPPDS